MFRETRHTHDGQQRKSLWPINTDEPLRSELITVESWKQNTTDGVKVGDTVSISLSRKRGKTEILWRATLKNVVQRGQATASSVRIVSDKVCLVFQAHASVLQTWKARVGRYKMNRLPDPKPNRKTRKIQPQRSFHIVEPKRENVLPEIRNVVAWADFQLTETIDRMANWSIVLFVTLQKFTYWVLGIWFCWRFPIGKVARVETLWGFVWLPAQRGSSEQKASVIFSFFGVCLSISRVFSNAVSHA